MGGPIGAPNFIIILVIGLGVVTLSMFSHSDHLQIIQFTIIVLLDCFICLYEQFLFINVNSCMKQNTDYVWEYFNPSEVPVLYNGIHFSKLIRRVLLHSSVLLLKLLCHHYYCYYYGCDHSCSDVRTICADHSIAATIPLHFGAIMVLQTVNKKKCVCLCVCLQERPRTLRMPLNWTMWSCLVCHWPSTPGCMHTLGGRYGPDTHKHTHTYTWTYTHTYVYTSVIKHDLKWSEL